LITPPIAAVSSGHWPLADRPDPGYFDRWALVGRMGDGWCTRAV